jgi:hypothetical protein
MLNQIIQEKHMAHTPAQLAVLNQLAENANISAEEVHPMTLKSLVNEGLVEVSDGVVFATGTVYNTAEEEVAVDPAEDEVTVSAVVEDEEDAPIMVERVVILADDISIQVGKEGELLKVLAGTEHPIISYHEEQTRKRILKWFNCLHVQSGQQFIVNSIRNTSKIIEPKNLTDFK